MYPGDPSAHPANVYNCRCTQIARVNGHEIEGSEIYKNNHSSKLEGVSWEEWKAGHNEPLTDEEKRAINRYISSDSYIINDELRRGAKLTQEDKQFVENLDSALKKMPKYKGTLFRAVDFTGYPDCDERTEDFLSYIRGGKKVTFEEYISASDNTGYNDDANIQVYIENSKRGRDIRLYNSNESEVLYERGSSFIVQNINLRNGKYYIWLKEERLK